jgi:hypothetical protein
MLKHRQKRGTQLLSDGRGRKQTTRKVICCGNASMTASIVALTHSEMLYS